MQKVKDIFKKHQAQTFPYPSCLEIKSAKGNYIIDVDGKKYLDFIAGVSACTLGHSHPDIIKSMDAMIEKIAAAKEKILVVEEKLDERS